MNSFKCCGFDVGFDFFFYLRFYVLRIVVRVDVSDRSLKGM